MITNEYVEKLYKASINIEENFALNTLLNDLNKITPKFELQIQSSVIVIEELNEDERIFLTKISTLIMYFFDINNISIPKWVDDERLVLNKPILYGERAKDSYYFNTLFNAPDIFKKKGVYFDLYALKRI